jgi:hypothetical protein
MKKIFTKLITIAIVLLLSSWSVNAQQEWNFSNTTSFPTGSGYPAGVTTVVNGLSIIPGVGIADFGVVGPSAKTLGGVAYTNRFKMNGAGYSPSADGDNIPATNMPTLRYLSFPVTGNTTITVDGASNTTATRNLFVTDGTNFIGKMTFAGSGGAEQTLSYYGPATTLYVFSSGTSSSSINLYDIRIAPAPPAITSFIVAGVTANIDQTAKTIKAELPYGSSLTSLTPTVLPAGYLPTGAQNFTNPVQYSATDGTTTTNYTVTLTVSTTPSSDVTLSDLKVDGTTISGFSPSITNYNYTVPYAYIGAPTVSVTTNNAAATAIVTQASNAPGSATVQVTAQNQVTGAPYIITFLRTAASTACKLTSFSVNNRYAVIDTIANTAVLNLQTGTDITNLTPTVSVSSLATFTPAGVQNFNSPINYVVTAQDGVTQKIYAVSVVLMDLRFGGPFPYETNFPVGFVMPPFMSSPTNGASFSSSYAGADAPLWYDNPTETTALTSSVIRLNSGASIEFSLMNCDSIIAKLTTSAAGSRTYNLYANGTQVATTGSVASAKTVIGIIAYKVNSAIPVVLSISSTETTGSNTLGYLKLTGTNVSGIQQIKLTGVTFDGQIIRNENLQKLNVFDTTGRLLINSNKDINMSGNSKGVYIVKGDNGILKIVLTK